MNWTGDIDSNAEAFYRKLSAPFFRRYGVPECLTLYGRVRYPLCGGCRCRPMQPMGSRQLAPRACGAMGLGIVRWRRRDFIRTRYRRRRFSSSLQKIWRNGDIHWPINEDERIHYCPYANMLRNHKAPLIVLWPLSASELLNSWLLRFSVMIVLSIVA